MGKAWFGFDFRSAKQKEQDNALYLRWAFPHGAAQRNAVGAVLDTLLARVQQEERLFCYLMLREAYWGTCAFGLPCAANDAAVLHKAHDLPTALLPEEAQAALALIRLDATMDEQLDYSGTNTPPSSVQTGT